MEIRTGIEENPMADMFNNAIRTVLGSSPDALEILSRLRSVVDAKVAAHDTFLLEPMRHPDDPAKSTTASLVLEPGGRAYGHMDRRQAGLVPRSRRRRLGRRVQGRRHAWTITWTPPPRKTSTRARGVRKKPDDGPGREGPGPKQSRETQMPT